MPRRSLRPIRFTGVSGRLSFVGGDAVGSAGNNSGAWTVRLSSAGAAPVETVSFSVRAYANNVRNLPRFQLGTGRLEGSGVLSKSSIEGGLISDTDDLTYYNVEDIASQVTGWTLQRSGPVARLVLEVRVVRSGRPDHCPVGTVGTITLVSSDERLPNDQSSDSAETRYPRPGGPQTAPDGGVACRTHVHGWNNADNPNTDPTRGGPGGGNSAVVGIR